MDIWITNELADCPACDGMGVVGSLDDVSSTRRYCKLCNGTGKIRPPVRICKSCRKQFYGAAVLCIECKKTDEDYLIKETI